MNDYKESKRLIPGFSLTLGITISMLSVIVIIPLLSIFRYALKIAPVDFLNIILQQNIRRAFWTSIVQSLIAAGINSLFGTIIAWVLVRYTFRFKRFFDCLIDIPLAMPTAVAGITLSKLYSDQGWLGRLLGAFGIHVPYTKAGLTIALIFVGIPFVVRVIQPVLQGLNSQYEEAAQLLGANKITVFRKIIFPEIRAAVFTGFSLAFARGLGEYGSVIYISGNSDKNGTKVISYVIMQKLNAGAIDYEGASAIALVLLVLSFFILLVTNLIQIRNNKRNY